VGSTPPGAWLFMVGLRRVLPIKPEPVGGRGERQGLAALRAELQSSPTHGESCVDKGLEAGRGPHGRPPPTSSRPISQPNPSTSVHKGLGHHVQLHIYFTD